MFAGGLSRQYIQANLDQGIHIDELARAAGLSLFHFAKLFKRSTGSSPHQYVLQRRLERAKELLRKTGLSLKRNRAASWVRRSKPPHERDSSVQ